MRKTPERINKLFAKHQFALMQLVQTEYRASGLSDRAFAELAANRIGCEVTAANVMGAREALEITSNLAEARKQLASPHTRLEKIEARLECLERLARDLGWQVPKYD